MPAITNETRTAIPTTAPAMAAVGVDFFDPVVGLTWVPEFDEMEPGETGVAEGEIEDMVRVRAVDPDFTPVDEIRAVKVCGFGELGVAEAGI